MLEPAIHAVEAVDAGIGKIVGALRKKKGALFVTADHGNCELMKDPATGMPHTSHTLNPVPLLYMNDADTGAQLRSGGRICDVAPTLLELLRIPQPAAIEAVQAVDVGIGRIAEAVKKQGGALIVTADHGNCEQMIDPKTGAPHTAHTLNPVPLLYMNDADRGAKVRTGGRICDVAPTMLEIMGLPKPEAMTGVSLLTR
jgi:bisphosphoglycerate-independent phosphoglycerate mutase (AlkP superfamily)